MILPETWKIGGLAAAAGVVLCVIAWLAVARANLKADLAQLRFDYASCQTANADWAEKTKTANDAIKNLQEEAEKRQGRAIEAQKTAAKDAARHSSKARTILSKKVEGSDCQAAQDLISAYLKDKI
jgi:hypothetical protein